MRFRPVSEFEGEELYGWILEWSDWFRRRGIVQWDPPYRNHRFSREAEEGEVWCLERGGEIRGMATISQSSPDYHPDSVREGAASWYMCRVTVPLRLRGTGAGAELPAAVEAKAARDGVRRLRIDVAETNPFLVEYWKRHESDGVPRDRPDSCGDCGVSTDDSAAL